MTETIRCPACRGAKKMPKLGGIVGECNTCVGKGTILAKDKPAKVDVITLEEVISEELIRAVSDSVPVSDRVIQSAPYEGNIQSAVNAVSRDIKVNGKKALYKRKQG